MANALTGKFTLNDLRAARQTGRKLAMLTCYDFTTARLMQSVGVPMLLVGDSAASVILGHESTLPISLDFLIELTAGVRRGAPLAMVIADMPFGSYHESVAQGVRNVVRMVQLSGCDCVKLEVAPGHGELVKTLADAGVAVIAHFGLRPQSIGVLGAYKAQGRTADAAERLVTMAKQMQDHGAAAILVEAIPPQVSQRIVAATGVPVIGCGAGPACHAHVVVTQDLLGLTPNQPKFVPRLGEAATMLKQILARYVDEIAGGAYPAAEHQYDMLPGEGDRFKTL